MSGHGTPRIPPTSGAALPPGTVAAPSGFLIPVTTYLTNQPLPGAGAFTAASHAVVPPGTKRVTFWITYTQGGAASGPRFRVQFSNTLLQDYRDGVQDLGSFAAAQPEGSTNFYQEDLVGPVPADGTPLKYQLTFELPAYAVAVDLLCAEIGNVGSPGNIAVDFTGDG